MSADTINLTADPNRVPQPAVTGEKPPLEILLCAPRGFCAGVVRAIDVVERALAIYGAPVYVRHEIVHNKYVVETLKRKGAVFVRELDEVPDSGAPVIFSRPMESSCAVRESRSQRSSFKRIRRSAR